MKPIQFGKLLLGSLAALSLGACASDGRPRLISKDETRTSRQFPDGAYLDLYKQFQMAAAAAKPTDLDNQPSKEKQLRFMEIGFELINLSCNTYIEGKVNRQRTINVWRDAFAPITALATGIIALTDKGDTIDHDALTALALFTSVTSSGFEIYEQRYLFGAKNVDNVRRLVLRAQLTHAQEAIAFDKDTITYWKAVRRLAENQMVCSPGSILEMVSKAIETGEITAAPMIAAKGAGTAAPPAAPPAGGEDGGGDGGEGTDGTAPGGPAPDDAAGTAEPASQKLFVPIEIQVGK